MYDFRQHCKQLDDLTIKLYLLDATKVYAQLCKKDAVWFNDLILTDIYNFDNSMRKTVF
jgi:hypothetical protein